MRNLTESEKKAFIAYVEEENQRIAPLPLKNVRRFFVDDTPPANFIDYYQWLKEMVLDSFLLLKPEQRPDGEFLHDTLSTFDVFIEELKTDAETPTIPAKEAINNEHLKTLMGELTKAQIEVATLRLLLGEYLQNKDFHLKLKVNIKLFKEGIKDESTLGNDFIEMVKTTYTNSPVKDDILKMLLQNGVFMVLTNDIAADYMKGFTTANEAQFKFIETTKQYWRFDENLFPAMPTGEHAPEIQSE